MPETPARARPRHHLRLLIRVVAGVALAAGGLTVADAPRTPPTRR